MPAPALLLILAVLCPLGAFGVLLFWGKRMGPLAGWAGVVAIGLAFVLTLGAYYLWLQTGMLPNRMEWGYGKNPIVVIWDWAPGLKFGLYIDSLTLLLFLMVTLVATLVHLYSIGYMRGEANFSRYFAYLGLFCFSMLGLLLAVGLVQLFIFWELVGLCSYLLIGFWHEKPTAYHAAIKAFVFNRVGDAAFLVGLGILFFHVGGLTLPELWTTLQSAGLGAGAGGMSPTLLSVAGICLFLGAAAKSAQFPLHGWLPSAMEGPTPVSALIHAATMVAAGVYLMARLFPILTPDAKLFIAITGIVTLTMGALIACVQSDIKRVLAYSTISQLGYMMLAIGVGSWIGALFHLLTHAFFKSLLFLGAGSVIHAADHEQEMSEFGGLMYKIPWTAMTFAVATAAISGVPYFSGFYSKEVILADAGKWAHLAGGIGPVHWAWQLMYIVPVVVAGLTAFYMVRCWMLTFWGRPRNQKIYDEARESPILWMPMLLLALLSIFAGGALGIRDMLQRSQGETTRYCAGLMHDHAEEAGGQVLAPKTSGKILEGRNLSGGQFAGFDTAWRAPADWTENVWTSVSRDGDSASEHQTYQWAMWALCIGAGLGFVLYIRGTVMAGWLKRIWPLSWIWAWLYNEMYFDELYYAVPAEVVLALSRLTQWIDQRLIDGAVTGLAALTRGTSQLANLADRYVVDGVVHGMADLAQDIGLSVRIPQNGRVRVYVTIAAAAVALGLTAMVAVMVF
jgi:proton-translocating NADH-quinone oxidoreductase chain L